MQYRGITALPENQAEVDSSATTGRPYFSRSNSSPRASASTSAPPINRAIRKRHSTYTLSPPPDRPISPVPVTPPQGPPRNPAPEPSGTPSIKTESKGRPPTATGTREEVTPWELFPAPMVDETPPRVYKVSAAPTLTRPPSKTNLVEEVTPWELYPPPTYGVRPRGGHPSPRLFVSQIPFLLISAFKPKCYTALIALII